MSSSRTSLNTRSASLSFTSKDSYIMSMTAVGNGRATTGMACALCDAPTACVVLITPSAETRRTQLCTICAPRAFGFSATILDGRVVHTVPMLSCGAAFSPSAVVPAAAGAVMRALGTSKWFGLYAETVQHDGLFVVPLPDDTPVMGDAAVARRAYVLPMLKMVHTATWEGHDLSNWSQLVLLAAYPFFCRKGDEEAHYLVVQRMVVTAGAVSEQVQCLLQSDGAYAFLHVADDVCAAASLARLPTCLPAPEVIQSIVKRARAGGSACGSSAS